MPASTSASTSPPTHGSSSKADADRVVGLQQPGHLRARALYAYLGTGEGYEALRPAYAAAVDRPRFTFFRAQGVGDGPAYDFFRHLTYDPAPTLAWLDVPLLALFGAEDRQVPTAASLAAMEAAFAASGHEDVELRVLEGEGHSLCRRVDGAPEMRPAYREALFTWLGRFE